MIKAVLWKTTHLIYGMMLRVRTRGSHHTKIYCINSTCYGAVAVDTEQTKRKLFFGVCYIYHVIRLTDCQVNAVNCVKIQKTLKHILFELSTEGSRRLVRGSGRVCR